MSRIPPISTGSSTPTSKKRSSSRSGSNFILPFQSHSNLTPNRQPYPRAKPRKLTIYPRSSNSKHSVDSVDNADAARYLKPKSRLKIAWSNENRTTIFETRATAQHSSKNASIGYQNDSEDSSFFSAFDNSPPIPPPQQQQSSGRAAAQVFMPVLHPTSFSIPLSQKIETHPHHKIPYPSSLPSSPIIPPISSVPLFEMRDVDQPFRKSNTALQYPQQVPSLQYRVDNTQLKCPQGDINEFMLSNRSESLHTSSSPSRFSSPVTTPGTSPSPMINVTSKDHQNCFAPVVPPRNVPSSPDIMLPNPPVPARTIHAIHDATLLALTEPFLMAWCQEIHPE